MIPVLPFIFPDLPWLRCTLLQHHIHFVLLLGR